MLWNVRLCFFKRLWDQEFGVDRRGLSIDSGCSPTHTFLGVNPSVLHGSTHYWVMKVRKKVKQEREGPTPGSLRSSETRLSQ